jgi:hypothetical protein
MRKLLAAAAIVFAALTATTSLAGEMDAADIDCDKVNTETRESKGSVCEQVCNQDANGNCNWTTVCH